MDGVLRSFQAFMERPDLPAWTVALGLSYSFFALVHELGHASVGLLRTDGLVHAHVGREPGLVHVRIGRLVLTFNPLPGEKRGGFVRTYAGFTRGEWIACVLAGPAVHALAGCVLVLVGMRVHFAILVTVGAIGLLDAVSNLVPRRRGDGMLLRQALRGALPERTALDDIVARAMVLYQDSAKHLGGLRAQVLAFEPVLAQTAFAGWCWGEASAEGWSREAAIDALHQATLSGAVEPELTRSAAFELARKGFSADRHVDEGFAPVRVPGANEARQRSAFAFGIALRDVERIRE
jgi:hypothetical protein